jgi:uroporphyrinogen decarboxylase
MTPKAKDVAFLAPFLGEARRPPPIWLMRQAGRYLPEYREVRRQAGSFWTMCMTPELATEVTLQPIRRFDLDAAILFSDILVVPFALGQNVTFEDGSGPRLGDFGGTDSLNLDQAAWAERLAAVYQALRATRRELGGDKALIGFAGAPWTLAAYMIEGHGTPDQKRARLYSYQQPQAFGTLLNILADTVAWHLMQQIEAGADVVQIFDSWAGGLPLPEFERWVVAPTRRIVEQVRVRFPGTPVIGFPRATTQTGYAAYLSTGVDAVSIDTATPLRWASEALGSRAVLQGNLDPLALVAGGKVLDDAVDAILRDTAGSRHIFNLGHGVVPETPPEHVAQLVARVRGERR